MKHPSLETKLFFYLNLDFFSVCEFFGVSIFPDELRGNLILAENEINRLDKSEKDDPDQAAALAILRATVLILQGRFGESTKTLDDLMGIEQVVPRWLF
jgi:hypothetical protein